MGEARQRKEAGLGPRTKTDREIMLAAAEESLEDLLSAAKHCETGAGIAGSVAELGLRLNAIQHEEPDEAFLTASEELQQKIVEATRSIDGVDNGDLLIHALTWLAIQIDNAECPCCAHNAETEASIKVN
jgi:hypothetical protein